MTDFGLYVVTLGGHHHGGDLINPLFIHFYFIPHPYNTVLILGSNRLEKLPSITIDVDRPGPCTARLLDPDRRQIVSTVDLHLCWLRFDRPAVDLSCIAYCIVFKSLFKRGKKTRLAYWCQNSPLVAPPPAPHRSHFRCLGECARPIRHSQ